MPAVLVALLSKLAGLGTMAKAAVASAAATATVAVGVGTVAVLHLPGGTSDAAEVAQGAVPPVDVGGPLADAGPRTSLPTDTHVEPPPTTVARPSATTPAGESRSVAPTTPTTASTTASTRTASVPTTASPVGVARRTPSDAEVQRAIDALPRSIQTSITPTPGIVATIGNQVCTAFDQGQTFAQVKTTGLRMLTQVPRTTVLPGGADWAVRTVVALYCPGHASKLV